MAFTLLSFFQVGDFEKEAQTAMIEAKKEIAIKQREAKVRVMAWWDWGEAMG